MLYRVDCDKTKPEVSDEVSVMGYSMRTLEFRYTVWLHFERRLCIPLLNLEPFEEEVRVISLIQYVTSAVKSFSI